MNRKDTLSVCPFRQFVDWDIDDKPYLVGGFKHVLFSISYMGMSSSQMTSSFFSRWLSHHQPGWRQTIDWCFQVQRIHGTAPGPLLCPGSLSKRRRFCSSARWRWHRRTSLDGYVWCLVDGDVRLQGATPYLAQLLQLSGWILGSVFFFANMIEVHGGYLIVIYQEIWLGRIDPL